MTDTNKRDKIKEGKNEQKEEEKQEKKEEREMKIKMKAKVCKRWVKWLLFCGTPCVLSCQFELNYEKA